MMRAQRFFEALLSPIGVLDVMEEVEVTRYELLNFMNSTSQTFVGIKEEH